MNRGRILGLIKKRPGIHFREITRELDIGVGTVSHHTHELLKAGLVKAEQSGKERRFYPIDISSEDKKILSLLRQPSLREILIHLLSSKRGLTNSKIAEKTSLSASTITHHIKALLSQDVLERKGSRFIVKNKVQMANLLISYQESFLDTLVDNFITTWTGFFNKP